MIAFASHIADLVKNIIITKEKNAQDQSIARNIAVLRKILPLAHPTRMIITRLFASRNENMWSGQLFQTQRLMCFRIFCS